MTKKKKASDASTVVNEKAAPLVPDHPNLLKWKEIMGEDAFNFNYGLFVQMQTIQGREGAYEVPDFLSSVKNNIKPRDNLEEMLLVQMAAVHVATMTSASQFAQASLVSQQDRAARLLTNFARTYAAQMEALKRYRTGGEQKVTVQHVSVSEGGQAIVGNVTHTPRATLPDKIASPASPAISDLKIATMTIVDEPEREAVPKREPKK
jgi:hypothetical protein